MKKVDHLSIEGYKILRLPNGKFGVGNYDGFDKFKVKKAFKKFQNALDYSLGTNSYSHVRKNKNKSKEIKNDK